jgi:hypothetical protein
MKNEERRMHRLLLLAVDLCSVKAECRLTSHHITSRRPHLTTGSRDDNELVTTPAGHLVLWQYHVPGLTVASFHSHFTAGATKSHPARLAAAPVPSRSRVLDIPENFDSSSGEFVWSHRFISLVFPVTLR